MNDTAIKNFAVWARRELMSAVRVQMQRWAIDSEGSVPSSAEVLNGDVITPQERQQRTELLALCKAKGADALAEEAAYTWFNRFVAIRFMELHDYLPCGMRFFSSPDGSFDPQVIRDALQVDIEGVEQSQVVQALRESGDEGLFRFLFIAQCNELAKCMPAVFEHVGSAMELLLPQGLLTPGSVLERMVCDIPEDDWREGVEIIGWMYQYYVSERKDEVFASFKKGKKAERDAIAPATQLFTPKWIVQYLVQNSLGRLWMLNHPDSHLAKNMQYYIAPDEEHETQFERVSSPEEIMVCDPACGSGHILVCAFDVLAQIYEEAGYRTRDIPSLILKKNLSGMEIDPRAAALASFALTMKAREMDSRFLRRGVTPDITVLQPVIFEDADIELAPMVAKQKDLVDAMAHADECGSLFQPTAADMAAIENDLANLQKGDNLFAEATKAKLEYVKEMCDALNRKFSVVVANPPYMGSSNMDKWVASYVKTHYPDGRRDLCTCFIERCLDLMKVAGFAGLATSNSWMFLSSFEALRNKIIDHHSIETLVQLSVHGFRGIAAQVCTFVLGEAFNPSSKGGYVRLDNFDHHSLQEGKTLEAVANPDCGWFYRRSAQDFKSIPGTPIAYWVVQPLIDMFSQGTPLGELGQTSKGLISGDNDKYFRLWWEISPYDIEFNACSNDDAADSIHEWFPLHKGGIFRKWIGNHDYVVKWTNDGADMRDSATKKGRHFQDYAQELKFKPNISWTVVSSGRPAFRWRDHELSDHVGMPFIPDNQSQIASILAFLNSSCAAEYLSFLSPTMVLNIGELQRIPFPRHIEKSLCENIETIVTQCCAISKGDWDMQEVSWGFDTSPLI